MDITYIRLRGGFLYLVAFLDWFSRLVIAWELSDTLEMAFVLSCTVFCPARKRRFLRRCLRSSTATKAAILQARSLRAAFFRQVRVCRWTDAGALWTTSLPSAYGAALSTKKSICPSMKVHGRLVQGLTSYLEFYNGERPHQALGFLTPAAVHAEPDRLQKSD